MKRSLTLLLTLALLVSLTSLALAEDVVGRWNATFAEYMGITIPVEAMDTSLGLELNEDGTALLITDEMQYEGTWILSGRTVVLTNRYDETDITLFTLQEGRLVVSAEVEDEEVKIFLERAGESAQASANSQNTAASSQQDFEVSSSIRFDGGYTDVFWTDSANNGPYRVAFRYYDGGNTVQTGFWAGGNEAGSTTSQKTFRLEQLVPGSRYTILVFDQDDNLAQKEITLPAAEQFVDGKLKASSVRISTEYRSIINGSVRTVNKLSAGDMMAHMDDREYGLYYQINLPELAYERDYFVQILFRAPNGYCETQFYGRHVFSKGNKFYYSLNCIGDDFFADMYEKNGVIPSGTYQVELYFNGMLANTKTFTVQP